MLRLFSFLLALALLAFPPAAQAQRVDQLPALRAAKAGTAQTSPRKKTKAKAAATAASPATSAPAPRLIDMGPIDERIAAVVNDGVISMTDVKHRMMLAMLSSGLPNTAEVREHLLPQVLRSLIDEQLQIQEGKRLEISIASEDIQKAMKQLARDNRIPNEDMAGFLNASGVPVSTLEAQIRSTLTWGKVVQRELRPRVSVGDDEIDAVIERMRANAGRQEYLISEIFLPVDSPQDEDQVRKFAQSLVDQVKRGTSFGALARQFSQGSAAASGGDIGWTPTGQLAPELDRALQAMNVGEMAGPIRAANGFHILGLREKRTIAMIGDKNPGVALQQAFRPFAANDRKAILEEAKRLRESVSDCKDLPAKIARDFQNWRWQDLGDVTLATAPSWIADKVRNVEAGHASEPMATDKGALILFVCGRKTGDINRAEIMNGIGTERMELLARRLLRDLRRNATIDVRMGKT